MTLELRHPASGLVIDADIPSDLIQLLEVQWARSLASDHLDGFRARVTMAVIGVLQSSVDWDLQPPTVKQCGLAAVIARKLSVPVPPDARRFRGAMTDFLAEFAPQLNAPKQRPASGTAFGFDLDTLDEHPF